MVLSSREKGGKLQEALKSINRKSPGELKEAFISLSGTAASFFLKFYFSYFHSSFSQKTSFLCNPNISISDMSVYKLHSDT